MLYMFKARLLMESVENGYNYHNNVLKNQAQPVGITICVLPENATVQIPSAGSRQDLHLCQYWHDDIRG